MAKKDLSKYNAPDRAVNQLNSMIKADIRDRKPKEISAAEALKNEKVVESDSERDVTRVLFISRNSTLLNPTQQSLDGYIDISKLFDEVHILILREGKEDKNKSIRVSDNVWIYTASAVNWWQTPSAGVDVAIDQLSFADGFRADLIVARDPFESALVARKLGKKFDIPTQLHVVEDYNTKEFIERQDGNYWRRFLPFFTVRKFKSVRTLTHSLKKRIEENFKINDLTVLPRYQDYQALIDKDFEMNLKEKYKPFIFFLLYVGRLDANSKLHTLLEQNKKLLRNPRVGLLVFGEGESKQELERKAKTLGLEGQVVFEDKISDPVPYMKASHILIVTDEDFQSEEVVLKGAACGVPIIMTKTDKRDDVFVDGESAFIIEQDLDVLLSHRINELINSIGLRHEFVKNAQEIIRNDFHSDPAEYLESYRNSIEQALFVD